MIINGKERKFGLTIEASEKIAELCENKDFSNLASLFNGKTFNESIRNTIKLAIIMDNAYQDQKAYYDSEYTVDYLTEDDFKHLNINEINRLTEGLMEAINEGTSTSVETEPVKSTGKKTEDLNQSQ